MAFGTALSGIKAASSELGIIGNNIANASTVGFKASRADFGDLYASGLLGASENSVGQGVALQKVSQQFTQGNISFTENALDMAINGEGFFQVEKNGSTLYTRAGTFSLDANGTVVNNNGYALLARSADGLGNITGGIAPLVLSSSNVNPNPTSQVVSTVNLDSREGETDSSFALVSGVPDPSGYNASMSTSIYDSLGNDHTATFYFSKLDPTTNPNEWNVRTVVDGAVLDTTTVSFNADGSYNSPASISVAWSPGGGATSPQNITLDLSKSTQYGSNFAVDTLNQDGYTTGQLLGLDIDSEGIIFARYSNGQSQPQGQVVLANFTNPQGLQSVGDTSWAETFSSGSPVVGSPGTGGLGAIQSNAVEEANVDLTAQLVQMIVAQRNFQANAQTIQAEDTINQTILNL